MRSAVVLALVAACGFSNSVKGGDDGTTDASTTSDGTMQMPDGMIDPPEQPVTRLVDIADAKVAGGPHTDFPVAVAATIAAAHPMAFDVYFSTDALGVTRLAHEIERYNASTGELLAWVKIPLLASSTTFYLHYGDKTITTNQAMPQAVWTAYTATWHLSTTADSKGVNNGTANGATPNAGRVAGAYSFNGSSNSIDVGSNASIDDPFAGGGSVEAWFFATSWGESDIGRIFSKGVFSLSMCNGSSLNEPAALLFGYSFSAGAGNWCTDQNTLSLDAWTHVAVVYNRDSAANVPTLYINGAPSAIGTGQGASGTAASDGASNLIFGDRPEGGRAFAGRIDELRLASTPRTAGWISTSYQNQLAPAMFAVVAP